VTTDQLDRAAAAARFWRLVDRRGPDECWPWLGTTNGKGYGLAIRITGPGTTTAHRVAFAAAFRDPDPAKHIDHLCHDPNVCDLGDDCPHRRCCNPAHLEEVTPLENLERSGAREATRRYWAQITHCPQGHPYDEANTYTNPKTGNRNCKRCRREKARARRAAQKVVSSGLTTNPN
jgi:hypothetical protein